MIGFKLIERIKAVKTVEVKIRRIPGMIISLLLLYLTAAVSIFVLKVAFVLAAVVVIFKSFSNQKLHIKNPKVQ
jgi:hypothetical protein